MNFFFFLGSILARTKEKKEHVGFLPLQCRCAPYAVVILYHIQVDFCTCVFCSDIYEIVKNICLSL